MINLPSSKANAKTLVDRFLRSGSQPDFMEYLHFKNCLVKADFYGYGANYVINKFKIYAAIASFRIIEEDGGCRTEDFFKVESCDFLCYGEDLIDEVLANSLEFEIDNGRLQIIRPEQIQEEVNYQINSYKENNKESIVI